jgi:AhpD family alkylhydroperoxidase
MGVAAERATNAPIAVGSIEWGACIVPATPAPPALVAHIRKTLGTVPGWVERIGHSPWMAGFACEMIANPFAYIPPDLCELIAVVVSQDSSCRYCCGVQRAVLKIHGYRDEYIDRLLRDFHLADLPRAHLAALDLARRVSRADPRPGREDIQAVIAAGLRREAAMEVAAMAAAGTVMNRVMTLLALPPESLEKVVKSPIFRFIRPLMARRMRVRQRAPQPPPRPNEGPGARIVAALGDSPMAGVVRRALDGAWASTVLPRRTKALVLAVVARALACAHGETEARRVLGEEGFAAGDVDEVLATLASPRLDAREARLVPFARETVRYQPATIQKRVRAVTDGFSRDELVETAGFVSLANGLCRLSAVLDAC